VPFPNLLPVEKWDPPYPKGSQHQQPLPATAEAFIGRNVETYRVITGVLDRRLVSVTGPAGVGKTAVAVAGLNYLAQRHHFSDGVVYVDCAGTRDAPELAGRLRVQVGRSVVAAAVATIAPREEPPARAVTATASSTGAAGSTDPHFADEDLALPRAAVLPLHGLHCLLVLDGVSADLAEAAGFAELLELLLSFPRVRTLLTAVDPVNRPLQGGAEKVLEMKPLSKHNTVRLICRLSPRPLQLDEITRAPRTHRISCSASRRTTSSARLRATQAVSRRLCHSSRSVACTRSSRASCPSNTGARERGRATEKVCSFRHASRTTKGTWPWADITAPPLADDG
jgi:hypothetical protein